MPANATSILNGYLVLRPASSRQKTYKRWFALLPDFVLYSFRSDTDSAALTATPVPGYCVMYGNELKGDSSVPDKDRDKIIKMFYGGAGNNGQAYKKVYYFAGTSSAEMERYNTVVSR